jgi:acyl-CoA thioester hydrolase
MSMSELVGQRSRPAFGATRTSSKERRVDDLLEGFPVTIEIPVAWGEMDAFGHVNNIVYFRYFESVRMECFERLGMTARTRETAIGPILHSTRCRYRIPLTYPDTVTAGTRIDDVAVDRFTMAYRVVSARHARVAAEGDGLIVMFDYAKNVKATISDDLRLQLSGLSSVRRA